MDSFISNVKVNEADREENKKMVEEYEAKNGPVELSAIRIDGGPLAKSRMYETSKQKKDRERKENRYD